MSETLLDGKIVLTLEEALSRLPAKARIHTFLQSPIALIGADWSRAQVRALLKEASRRDDKAKQIQETGPAAQRMGHGLAVWRPEADGGTIFIEASGPDGNGR